MATQIKTGLIANDAITDAKIANVALTGVTASSGDSSTSLATTAFVAGEINSLIDSAPGALNTLNELAAAMGDDANFSTTVTNSIAGKVALSGSGQTIADSGNLTLDVAGELIIDTDTQGSGNGILLKDGGTLYGSIFRSSSHLHIKAEDQNKNLLFLTNNGGSELTAMTINHTGNVGIGTSSPVNNGTNSQGLTINGTGNYQNLALQHNGSTQFLMYLNGPSGTFIDQVTADPLMFLTSDTERLRIGAVGELQLGGTTNAGFIDFDGTSLQFNTQRNPNTGAFVNTSRAHAGITLSSASANSHIKFYTQSANNTVGHVRMQIDKDGKVGIGEQVPLGMLHVRSSDSGASADASADDLVVENNSNTGISILSGTSSTGSIYFGDSGRNWDGYIAYSHGSSPSMTIASNGGGNYIKLDDTGHVGLSTTPTAWGSGYKSLQIGDRGFVAGHTGSDLYVGQNAYHNSGWKYEAGVAASLTQHSGGQIGHYIAPIGSAGNSISWNAALFIDTNSKTTLTRTVNGSSSIDYANILEIKRIGGATSNNRREAVISFFDSANSTYTAMISGVRTSPAGNYDGGLAFYTNSHSQNANATSISEMVSGRVLELYADQHAEFFGSLYSKDVYTRPSSGSGIMISKVIAKSTPPYTVTGQPGTWTNWYQPARGESGQILFGNVNNAGGEYRCAGFIIYSSAEANNTPPAISIAVTESINGYMVEFQVSNGWIQVKNTYGYSIELMGYVQQFLRT